MRKVYLLIHAYEFCDTIETKFLGIYSTRKKAHAAQKRYYALKGFCQYPESCFSISPFELDQDKWPGGFVSSDEIYDEFREMTMIVNEMAGVDKTPEQAWEDEDYYYILCEISRRSYSAENASDLAEYMQQLFREYRKTEFDPSVCMETAEKILQNVK